MIELSRDVAATAVPEGARATLPRGSRVEVTQQLGGSFTVMTDLGLMRVEGRDADALGLPLPPEASGKPAEPPADANAAAALVWEKLRTCYDPEIPVDIVELGLIYENRVEPHPQGGFTVSIKMTLTSPGCPLAPMMQTEARGKILSIPGVRECAIEVVWDPPWEPSRMSEAAKLKLGFL